jgi:hypothetical protein
MFTEMKSHKKYPIMSAMNTIACHLVLTVGFGGGGRFFNSSKLCINVTAFGTFCLSAGSRS